MGLKTKYVLLNSTLSNMIEDDDVNHKGKYFWRERKTTKFFNHIFALSPYRFTQISSVGSCCKFHVQWLPTLEIWVNL
jgi:hypothetical protein